MAQILITGCRSGIGLETANLLARSGHTVHAGLRSLPSSSAGMPDFAPGVISHALDVTNPDDIARCVAAITATGRPLDALVNNAGVCLTGPAEDLSMAQVRQVMEVNFFGAVAMTRAVLPLMRGQGSGQVIMISSLSGIAGLPCDGAYAASKHALEGWSESLTQEVAPFGMRVHLLQPGAIRSELMKENPAVQDNTQGDVYGPLTGFVTGRIAASQDRADSPRVVAQKVKSLIEDPVSDLRHPVGEQAEIIAETLRGLSDRDRQALLREASGCGWWSDGTAPPRG